MTHIHLFIRNESDVYEAVRQSKKTAEALAFCPVQANYIATATSELASNLFLHAGEGVITIKELVTNLGIEIMTVDNGPGILDVERALQDGYSTGGGLGCGLPGVKRLMDELVIDSQPNKQTIIIARKWLETSELSKKKLWSVR